MREELTEEMIEEMRAAQPKEGEVKLWTVAVGNPVPPWASRKLKKAGKEAIEYIKTLEGFVGVNPVPGKGTLLLFRTENQAKGARNLLNMKGCPTGRNICACFVEKKYVPEEADNEDS